MITPLQLAGLVGFNVMLVVLAIMAVRLIGGRSREPRLDTRTDDLFSFDSWSGSSSLGAEQPAAAAGRPRPRNGF